MLLHRLGGLETAMFCLVDEGTGDLLVSALHSGDATAFESIRYRPGEGVVGTILIRGERGTLFAQRNDELSIQSHGAFGSPVVGDEGHFILQWRGTNKRQRQVSGHP